MREIYRNIFVGDISDCKMGQGDLAVIHACKYPCHRNAVGYNKRISPSHPNYLVLEKGQNLYLNMIDPDEPLFMNPLFVETLRFCKTLYKAGKKLLFHCNQGDSRAPTLALIHLSKNIHVINDSSYKIAVVEYKKIDSSYRPGLGIQIYLEQHWHEF